MSLPPCGHRNHSFIAQRSCVSAPQVAGLKNLSSRMRQHSAAVGAGLRASPVKKLFFFQF
jgi:hypothetical protein